MPYKNLIFDLGGVIIDLSIDQTVNSFSRLSGLSPTQIQKAYHNHDEFYAYEKGELTDDEFRLAVQRIFSFEATTEEIDTAWNAMLAGLPQPKLSLLERLKDHYSLTVLSNTNSIHLDYVNRVMLPEVSSHPSLNHYFHRHYYSHLVGKRKPEPEIFYQVLHENNFNPKETLFLDDNPDNIQVALRTGIQAKLIEHPDRVYDFFKDA